MDFWENLDIGTIFEMINVVEWYGREQKKALKNN